MEFSKSRRGAAGHSRQVEWHVRRLRSIRFYRKPLNALGHEAGAVLEVEEEEISKPGKS